MSRLLLDIPVDVAPSPGGDFAVEVAAPFGDEPTPRHAAAADGEPWRPSCVDRLLAELDRVGDWGAA